MSERYFVAIATLATPIEVEAKALAADLGTTAYEERLKLAGAFPAIVLATVDEAAAQGLAGKLRARKHRALLARGSEVVAAEDMVGMRHFAITANGLESGGEELAWTAVSVLVRARQLKHVETTSVVKEKKLALGRAVLTGGLLMRKTSTREVTTRAEDIEQVLYVFRNDGGTPWLMRELSTNYGALGAALAPNAHANFGIATELFRKRAPHARFDDSLLRRPAVDDVDLFAHLIARS